MNEKKELNILIRNNNDCDGITEAIINEFKRNYQSVKGVVLDANYYSERARDKFFEYIPSYVYEQHDSLQIREAQNAISGNILENMLPYKSMAMHIMMRNVHYDVYTRKYLEDVYYSHLKYWNELLDKHNIQCAIFMAMPHHCGEYILYSLCKIKNISTILLNPQLLQDGTLYMMGDSMETMGENVGEYYETLHNVNITENDLSSFMIELKKNTLTNRVIGSNKRKEIIKSKKKSMYSSISVGSILILIRQYISHVLKRKKPNNFRKVYLNNIATIIEARKYERRMDHLNTYRNYEEEIRKGEKYIYFPLQMTPEASTMPLAGEFKNQLLSIELIAEAARQYGWYVYVKEHWVQFNREKGFYKKLSEIDNVRLIKLETNSIELINNAQIVATQTGSCIFESLLKKKIAIAIGRGYTYKKSPNVRQVMDVGDVKKVIMEVQNGVNIQDEEITKYLYALQEKMVYSYLDGLHESSSQYNKKDTAKKIVDYYFYERDKYKHE